MTKIKRRWDGFLVVISEISKSHVLENDWLYASRDLYALNCSAARKLVYKTKYATRSLASTDGNSSHGQHGSPGQPSNSSKPPFTLSTSSPSSHHLRGSRHKKPSSLHTPYCSCTPYCWAVHQHGANLCERGFLIT